MRRTLLSFVAALGCLSTLGWAIGQNPQWRTASAQDILGALGPDAQGLPLTSEKLPDLFELTASRLEEQPKKFVVEQSYTAGRWKGGKAVIEYARDLSYTLVSVYDQAGRRQRIYSVRARMHSEPEPQQVASAPATASHHSEGTSDATVEPDLVPEGVQEGPSPSREPVPAPKQGSASRRIKHSEKSASSVVAAPAPVPVPPADEKELEPSTAETPTSKSGKNHQTVALSSTVPRRASSSKTSGSRNKKSAEWSPEKPKHDSKIRQEEDVVDLAAAEPGAAYEWDEKQGAYVPVSHPAGTGASKSSTKTDVAQLPAPLDEPDKKQNGHSHTKHKKKETSETVSQSPSTLPQDRQLTNPGDDLKPTTEAQKPHSLASHTRMVTAAVPVRRHGRDKLKNVDLAAGQAGSAGTDATLRSGSATGARKTGSREKRPPVEVEAPPQVASVPKDQMADSVPSTEELLTAETPASSSKSSQPRHSEGREKHGNSKRSKGAPGKETSSKAVSSSKSARKPNDTVTATVEPTPLPGSDSTPIDVDSEGVTTMTPSELAALSKKGKAQADEVSKSRDAKTEPPPPQRPVELEPTPVPEVEVKPVTTMTPSERAAAEAAKRAKEHPSRPAVAASSKGPTTASYDSALDSHQSGHGKLDSDQWSPKEVAPAPPVEEEIPAPVKVAMLPKPVPAPDASIDSLLKIAAQNQNATVNEGANWVPKAAKASPADVDVTEEINRIRSQKPAAAPVVKVKRDINNPEEGVLPVNSFEKFAGPRYGRHREYERRFYLGKRVKAKITAYDFYVDEVDRKKEIHNIYYYQKGAAPKLVAVERHAHVTFLSNYDVDNEDKGKLIKY